jgi:hypothetical protein
VNTRLNTISKGRGGNCRTGTVKVLNVIRLVITFYLSRTSYSLMSSISDSEICGTPRDNILAKKCFFSVEVGLKPRLPMSPNVNCLTKSAT